MKDFELIEEFIPCECHSEHLLLTKFGGEDDNFVYICFYEYGSGRIRWKYRLRYIWDVLVHGKTAPNEVILSEPQVQRLMHFCDVVLNKGVYSRPWCKDYRSGEID